MKPQTVLAQWQLQGLTDSSPSSRDEGTGAWGGEGITVPEFHTTHVVKPEPEPPSLIPGLKYYPPLCSLWNATVSPLWHFLFKHRPSDTVSQKG